jgi:hypothetical protein
MDTFIEQVDWPQVIAELVERRVEVEHRVVQRVAEIRAAGRPERYADKVELARMQDNVDACDELLERMILTVLD